jgi:hypothetical protein
MARNLGKSPLVMRPGSREESFAHLEAPASGTAIVPQSAMGWWALIPFEEGKELLPSLTA